jgi:SpoVK/Ycf46/Vps4 family AAA+-type ATPase
VRPHGRQLRLAELAQDLEGFSAAQIRSVVDEAALAALEAGRPIRRDHLRSAYRAHVTASRYGGVRLGWDDLILPTETKRRLQLIEQVIENPQIVRQLGITPPSGILLSGPPGTGKTTIARVLASERAASRPPAPKLRPPSLRRISSRRSVNSLHGMPNVERSASILGRKGRGALADKSRHIQRASLKSSFNEVRSDTE